MNKFKLVKDIFSIFLDGYNPFVKSISFSGEFFWNIIKNNSAKKIIVLIDSKTKKRNRIISELVFLDRKDKLNLRVVNLDEEKFSALQLRGELLISFVDTDILDDVPGAFLLTDKYVEKENAVFSGFFADSYFISIFDKEVYYSLKNDSMQKNLKIQAIITCYNEEDVIAQTIEYLTNQGIQVHIIDNWSTDRSAQIIEKATLANSLVTSEKYPLEGPSKTYDWKKLLKRVESFASEHADEFDWFIHHDADEIREAPFRDIFTLRDGIQVVDDLGYNAVDHTVINFALTKDGFDGSQEISQFFKYFEFGSKKNYHHKQIKAWKSVKNLDLASSGGHGVEFENRAVFPYRFLLRHYPLRSVEQAKKKIFKERKPRWNEEERKDKWHAQYDDINEDTNFLKDKNNLIEFNRKETYKKYLMELIFLGTARDK